jgi:hypothetical protein
MNKWNCIKIKSFCTGREIVTRLKRQPTEWEKISTNNSSHKGIIFRIYRELQKLNPQRINFPMKKWLHELNREFSKEDVPMASKYMKKCSISLVITEMHIKTTLTFHLIQV